MCAVLLPPAVNPNAVNKYININIKSDTVILTEEFVVDLGSFLFLRRGKPIVIRFVRSNQYFVACHTVQLLSVMFNVATAVHNFVACHTVQLLSVMFNVATAVHNFDLHTKRLTND